MKLPRWLLIGLWTLSLLAVLAGAGWWWVTWPVRTANEFVDLVRRGDFQTAEQMLPVNSQGVDWQYSIPRYWDAELELKPITWRQLVSGRRDFKIKDRRSHFFTAEHGKIYWVVMSI